MKLSAGQRTLASQFVIAAAVCGAGYHFLVEPAKLSLIEARAKVSALLSQSGQQAPSSSISEDKIATIRDETLARAAQIQRRSAPARNEALMFAAVSAFAKKHNVRLDQVQASQKARQKKDPTPPPPTAEANAAAATQPQPADVTVGYAIVAQGTYIDIAKFVGDLSRNMGYTVISGLRITLLGDDVPDMIRADIVTEHFGFDVSTIVSSAHGEAKP